MTDPITDLCNDMPNNMKKPSLLQWRGCEMSYVTVAELGIQLHTRQLFFLSFLFVDMFKSIIAVKL